MIKFKKIYESVINGDLSKEIYKESNDWQKYLYITPKEMGGEYYVLHIPVGVTPPEKGSSFILNNVRVISLTPKSPEDIAAGRGGPVARSMRENGIAYCVNCLPEGHKWLQ
jgi:hypothetical protein